MSLYRTYRPQKFSEVCGHEHIVKTLQASILYKSVHHAYLFCGTRGSGKTTLARIYSKTLNCESVQKQLADEKIKTVNEIEPCLQCTSCTNQGIDIQEIDAASHRGIDEIREIQESARVSSFGSKYKVFIIDETHMLSTAACNALLKVLEEPPAHVIFILATTEPHKLLPTILSRVQRFDFRPLSVETITSKLKSIIANEKLQADEQALTLIAKGGRGSMRDAESVLERMIALSKGNITHELVSTELGIMTDDTLDQLLRPITDGDSIAAMAWIRQAAENGVRFDHLCAQLIEYIRDRFLIQQPPEQGLTTQQALALIRLFMRAQHEIPHSIIPQLPLEMAALEAASVIKKA